MARRQRLTHGKKAQVTFGVLACVLSSSLPAHAQWLLNGTFLGSPYAQDMLPQIAPDGAAGAIVA